MFDFDIGKLMVVAIVALAVIPPKDLPRVMRTVGQVVGKMRRMAAEFQGQFMDAMREADLENVRKELEALNEKANVEAAFDPAAMIRDEVTKASHALESGASEVALTLPGAASSSSSPAPADAAVNLDDVRRELEALNEKARADATFDAAATVREDATEAPQAVGVSAAALGAEAESRHGAPARIGAPAASQSAAE